MREQLGQGDTSAGTEQLWLPAGCVGEPAASGVKEINYSLLFFPSFLPRPCAELVR